MQSSAGLKVNHFISKYVEQKLLLRHSRRQKRRLQNAHCATAAPHADAPAVAAHRCDLLRRLEARHGWRAPPLRAALVDQQHIVARCEDVSARLVLGSVALDKREAVHENLPHLLAGGHVSEAQLSERCEVRAHWQLIILITRPVLLSYVVHAAANEAKMYDWQDTMTHLLARR